MAATMAGFKFLELSYDLKSLIVSYVRASFAYIV